MVSSRIKSTEVLWYLLSHNMQCMKVLQVFDGLPEKIGTVDFISLPLP